MNKAILLGNLGRDPELRHSTSQTRVCSFSIATTEKRKDATGQWVDQTEWHNIITFGSQAENCAKYLSKGSKVLIEGKIQTRKWQDKEGNNRYTTEIIAQNVQFLNKVEKKEGTGNEDSRLWGEYDARIAPVSEFSDDDIPF